MGSEMCIRDSPEDKLRLDEIAKESHVAQKQIEKEDTMSFDRYLFEYFEQYRNL